MTARSNYQRYNVRIGIVGGWEIVKTFLARNKNHARSRARSYIEKTWDDADVKIFYCVSVDKC